LASFFDSITEFLDMKKMLLFAAALLFASGLAHGAGPSATLSVQVVPASIPCAVGPPYMGTIPAGAQAAGFTTCAANYDFTNTTAYNSGNMSTWLSCPDSGNPGFQLYCVRPGSSVFPPSSDMVLVNDGGAQALQVMFTPTDQANGVGGTVLNTFSGQGNPNPTGAFFPNGTYTEYVARVTTGSLSNPAGLLMGGLFYGDPHNENWIEKDVSEFYTYNSGGPSNGWLNNGAGILQHCVGNFNCQFFSPPFMSSVSHQGSYDPTVYQTYGLRFTLDTSGNLGACSYLNGSQLPTDNLGDVSCISRTFLNGASDSAINARLGIVMVYANPQGTTISNPIVFLYHRVTVWTCATYQTGPCANGIDVGTP
jgi:hypothetical protein